MNKRGCKEKKHEKILIAFLFLLSTIPSGLSAYLSISIGDYDTSVYVNTEVVIPVTVTSDNVTGNVQVTISPKSGFSCKQP
jgi:hypothetical protein